MKNIKDDPAFVEGMEAFLMGDWKVAKESFLLLDKNFPNNEHITFILGNTVYSLGELAESVKYYKKTIEINTDCGNAYYKMGVSFFKMGRFNEAFDAFKKSTEAKGSQHVMVYYYMGLISNFLSKDDEAVAYFDKLRVVAPETKMALFFESQLKIKRHEFDSAVEMLEQFLEVSPDFAEAYHLLGVAYKGLYKNMEALKAFRKAVELNPADKRSALEAETLSETEWP